MGWYKGCLAIYLLVVAWIDYRHKRIDNRVLLLGAILTLVGFTSEIMINKESFIEGMMKSLSGSVAGVGLLFLSWASRKIGIADGLIVIFIGMGMGFVNSMEFVLVSIFIASLCSGILLAIHRAKLSSRIPYIPFAFFTYLLFWYMETC